MKSFLQASAFALLLILTAIGGSFVSAARPIRGSVVPSSFCSVISSVIDGDTVKVIFSNRTHTIRLFGIDAPETMQRYGRASTLYARALLQYQTVTVRVYGGDRYGRLIGDITLQDGARFANFMVASGSAWWYRQYAGKDKVLHILEHQARDAKLGLWADEKPIAPWIWRHMRHRPISRSL
jgi:endonuclease YncB( thermonuclease family)